MKYVASKHTTVQHIALFAVLVVSSAANAATYDYTGNYAYMRKPAMSNAHRADQLQVDTVTCNNAAGAQYGMPAAGYRGCRLEHGWKFRSLTRTRIHAAPADRYFSSNVKVAPDHFIDHDAPFLARNKKPL